MLLNRSVFENITGVIDNGTSTVNTSMNILGSIGGPRPTPKWFVIYTIRVSGIMAVFMNVAVLLCLLQLKKTFRSKDYWFQLVLLSLVDAFNGITTMCLSLVTFPIHYAACSIILCLFIFSQINTLSSICCVCVNRFRCLQNMEQKRDEKTLCRQEVAVAAISFLCLAYCSLPYLILDTNKSDALLCRSTILFGSQDRYYKLHASVGVFIPLIIINVLYTICVVKLFRSRAKISPSTSTEQQIDRTTTTQLTTQTCSSNSVATPGTKMASALSIGEGLSETEPAISSATSSKGAAVNVTQDKLVNQPAPVHNNTVFKARKEAQTNAMVLLGIILLFANIGTIYPFADMMRIGLRSDDKPNPGNSLAISFLSLNPVIDAIVYGFYSKEIRNYLKSGVSKIKTIVTSKF